MPDYRRYYVAGGTYFFTLVTAGRAPLFRSATARLLLGRAMREKRRETPFETVAIVLLPDHLHVVWTLPAGDANYPGRWQAIKARFTSDWLKRGGSERAVSEGYQRQRRRGVWQPRFIEHTIRDEEDLCHHADYLHYNPVKHGYARRPKDWPWSSFHRYVLSGDYQQLWGADDQPPPDFGDVDEDLLE
ncbi:MAG: transposase [Planctomycetes bacterium]|nr:transposase [Planctomycetota bacterium]MBU4400569.1 transposase [Planctomycetota bacterium]MCG2682861.1 transposase [Planctomycetales bacterium]